MNFFDKSLFIFSLALLPFSAVAEEKTYSMMKGPRTSKPLVVYAAPADNAATERKISVEEFKALGTVPVLEEKNSYIRILDKNDKSIWILSEKVELARSIECGQPTPAAVIKTVKSESDAARGIGEACGRKGK